VITSLTGAKEAQATIMGAARPRFVGILGGELFKVSRMRIVWVVTVLLAGIIAAPYLFYLATPGVKRSMLEDPLSSLFAVTQRDLAVLRVFGGIYLLIVSALVIGLEYQEGTIRVLLARGVGRLQLLGEKVLALVIVALVILGGGLLLDAILTCGLALALVGNLDVLRSATPEFWRDAWLYLLTVMVSMGVTLLLAVAATAVSRSLAVGLGVGLSWFPADNITAVMLLLIGGFTRNDFWLKITGLFLGPNLNLMPAVVVPARVITVHADKGVHTISQTATSIGFPPLVSVDGAHTLMVALAYAVIFAAVAIVLTWRRDVLE
jgi:ABC-2 type transport system permease protein